MSLAYLFFIGVAFAAIWMFHNDNALKSIQEPTNAPNNTLAFEENHKIVEVTVIKRLVPQEKMAESRTKTYDMDFPIEHEPPSMIPALKAWEVNAVKISGINENRPQISIVIDDMGVVKSKTENIINISAPLTLSFLPYADDLVEVTRRARQLGHELMIHLPMEPKGDMDPGPHAMITGSSKQNMMDDLLFNLSQFEGYVGLNNHMGSAFTEDSDGLNLILNEVQKRGLLVLDSRTSRGSLLAKISSEKNIPNMTRDIFLDNEQNVTYILRQLEKLTVMAQRRGSAVAIGHPYKETIEALSLWLPSLESKGISIVPLSHLIKKKYSKILLAKTGGTSSSSK